jgi:hypothetical protein
MTLSGRFLRSLAGRHVGSVPNLRRRAFANSSIGVRRKVAVEGRLASVGWRQSVKVARPKEWPTARFDLCLFYMADEFLVTFRRKYFHCKASQLPLDSDHGFREDGLGDARLSASLIF